MKAVIQVVNNATLKVENKLISKIGQGIFVLSKMTMKICLIILQKKLQT